MYRLSSLTDIKIYIENKRIKIDNLMNEVLEF